MAVVAFSLYTYLYLVKSHSFVTILVYYFLPKGVIRSFTHYRAHWIVMRTVNEWSIFKLVIYKEH